MMASTKTIVAQISKQNAMKIKKTRFAVNAILGRLWFII